ncbi:MAG: ThuA domain-containing protein [Chthoniobacterales bacterium]|nr:ThuA domain-containing protein [Chthoniobacterales bacterium]
MDEQSKMVSSWLGENFAIFNVPGAAAFDALEGADLLVIAGLHYTGMNDAFWNPPMEYVPPTEAQKQKFRDYLARGGRLLGFHGGVASFGDWPEFGELCGVRWDWKVTTHGPIGATKSIVAATGHPAVAGFAEEKEFVTLDDETYLNLQMTPRWAYDLHAWSLHGGVRFPMLVTADRGPAKGSGRMAYIMIGHSVAAMETPEVRKIWQSTIDWLLA